MLQKDLKIKIWHGLEALLRYKENESKIELVKRDKVMGVDYFLVDVKDKQNRQTRFFISAKSFQVKMLEYAEGDVKYRRKFYDYNYVQGTLVPYRSVLWADGKQVEETEIQTISFGQKSRRRYFSGKLKFQNSKFQIPDLIYLESGIFIFKTFATLVQFYCGIERFPD